MSKFQLKIKLPVYSIFSWNCDISLCQLVLGRIGPSRCCNSPSIYRLRTFFLFLCQPVLHLKAIWVTALRIAVNTLVMSVRVLLVNAALLGMVHLV